MGAIAWFATALVHEPIGRADEPRDADLLEARRHFQAGVNMLDDPDGAKYEEALLAFRKAYELSRSPKILGNIGYCAMNLERDGEAIDAYSAYLREAPDVDDRERLQIQKDLTTLSWTVARFRAVVKEPGSSFLLVDTRVVSRGSPVVNSYPMNGREIVVRLRPGHHSFKVKTTRSESAPFDTTLEPSSGGAHEFTFPVAPPSDALRETRRPSPVGPLVVGGAGLALVGAGVITGILASNQTSDIESKCPNDVCPPSYDFQSDKDSARRLSTIADVSFIAGGALVGSALVWYLLQSRPSSRPAGATQNWISADCTGHGCGFRIQRSFQ